MWWLALPTFGEAWHHNHHAFPRSATHGLGRLELDPSAAVIWAMEKLGLVWDVVQDHARAPDPAHGAGGGRGGRAARALAARHGVTPGGRWSCPSL